VRRGGADAATLDMLGQLEAVTGQPQAAAEALRRAAELAPSNAELLARLAAARLASGDVVGATEAAGGSLRLAPDQRGARAMLAVGALMSGDIAAAEAEFARLPPEAKQTPGGRLLEGTLQAARMQLPQARATLEALVRDQPDFQPARLTLARVATVEGRTEDAERLLTEVLRAEPGNAEAGQQLAGIALSRGPRAAEARQALVAAQAAAPDNTQLAAVTARVLGLTGDIARAVTLLEAAPLQQRGRGPQMPMLLAEARVAAGDLTGAEAASRTALAEDPRSVPARRLLAIVLARKGDLPAAETILREGRITQPADPMLQGTLVAVVREARGLDAALALADQIAQRPEARPSALTLRGDLLAGAGRAADAAQAFADAYAVAPSSELALRRAAVLSGAGRQAEAAVILTEWLAREPDNLPALALLAQFDLQAGRHEDAERRLTSIVARQPANATALNNLAWSLAARGAEMERALALAERAYFLAPSPASADTLGWVLVRNGNLDRGVTLLRQATQASRGEQGPDPSMAYRLAYGLKALGRREEAIAVLRPVLAGGTAFPERRDAERLMADLGAGR
jgi:putative PEP-CTERM system TPR-repeat lipoprotein